MKTFVFENEMSARTENLEISIKADSEFIDIKYIVNIWKHQNEIHKPLLFKIYDPEVNRYVPLNLEVPISQAFFYSPVIMIQYSDRERTHSEDDVESQVSSRASEDTKRERNRERTIREVLEYVK